MLRYENLPRAECAIGDVRVTLASTERPIQPVDAFLVERGGKQYECHYWFDVTQFTLNEFSIDISPEKLRCSVPILRLKRDSGYMLRGGAAT